MENSGPGKDFGGYMVHWSFMIRVAPGSSPRVPANKFDSFWSHWTGLARLKSAVYTDDVTMHYIDPEARLKTSRPGRENA